MGYTIAKQAEELNLSIDQVNKDIVELKKFMMILKNIIIFCLLERKTKKNYGKNNYNFNLLIKNYYYTKFTQ